MCRCVDLWRVHYDYRHRLQCLSREGASDTNLDLVMAKTPIPLRWVCYCVHGGLRSCRLGSVALRGFNHELL